MDRIPPKKFVGPACVLDISAEVTSNPNYLLTTERFLQWEQTYGRIPAGAWVLLRSDWSKRTDAKDYINLKDNGPHTPGLAKETSLFLAKERDVLGVGVETVGTDAGQAATFDPPFPNHYLMHGSGKFGLASLANLDQLPPTGAIVIAAPLKIVGGSAVPCASSPLLPEGQPLSDLSSGAEQCASSTRPFRIWR